jgi:GntR family transcriptional regulator
MQGPGLALIATREFQTAPLLIELHFSQTPNMKRGARTVNTKVITFLQMTKQFPSRIDSDSPIPLYLQLKELILGEIESGIWSPGDRMPGDDELCQRHQVSRTTVRLALKELEIAGLIVRQRGRGTFLTQPKISHFSEPPHRLTDTLLSRGIKPGWSLIEAEAIGAPGSVASALEIEEGSEVFRSLRLRLAGDEVIGVVVAHAVVEADSITRESLERDGPSLQYLARVISLKDARVDRIIEAVSATQREAGHLEVEEGAPILAVQRILRDERGKAIEHYCGHYRGDRFQYIASGDVHEVETQMPADDA